MQTVLIIGGGGYVGSNLAAALVDRGSLDVVVCDYFGDNEKWRNLSALPVIEIIKPINLSIWLEANHKRLEMLFYLGTPLATAENDNDIDNILKINYEQALTIWRWCEVNQVRFLYASSCETYGNGSQGFEDSTDLEYMRQLKPMSAFGWSKHLFDMNVARSTRRGECQPPQWVGLKFFNVYGPNEYNEDNQCSIISKMIRQALWGTAVRLFRPSDLNPNNRWYLRDWLHVEDAVHVMLWFLDNPDKSGLFNLGTGEAVSDNDVATAIFLAIGRTPHFQYPEIADSLRRSFQCFTRANIQKLRLSGYHATFIRVEDGIADILHQTAAKPVK